MDEASAPTAKVLDAEASIAPPPDSDQIRIAQLEIDRDQFTDHGASPCFT